MDNTLLMIRKPDLSEYSVSAIALVEVNFKGWRIAGKKKEACFIKIRNKRNKQSAMNHPRIP